MGNIIKFPRRRQRYLKRVEDFYLERLPDHQQHCNNKDAKFTCASCGTQSNFSFSGVIFKDLTFYCGNCGIGYKMSNPLFSKGRRSNTQ